MKFKVEKSSDWSYQDLVQIDTLEELFQFMKSNNTEDIVLTTSIGDELPVIEIYDDYRE